MSYSRFKMVHFGSGKSGLATIGYQLFNQDGSPNGSRSTSGVSERGDGTGSYGAAVTFPSGFIGELRWDTGESEPVYASEDINPSIDEGSDVMLNNVPGTYPYGTAGYALGRLAGEKVTLVNLSPLVVGGKIELVQDDDYANSISRAITFTIPAGVAPDITGWTTELLIGSISAPGTITQSGAGVQQQVRVDLTAAQTDSLVTPANANQSVVHLTYQLIGISPSPDNYRVTLGRGTCQVLRKVI